MLPRKAQLKRQKRLSKITESFQLLFNLEMSLIIKNITHTLKCLTSHLLRKSCIQLSHWITVKPSYFHPHYLPKVKFSYFLYLTSWGNYPKAYLEMKQGMFSIAMLKISMNSFSFQRTHAQCDSWEKEKGNSQNASSWGPRCQCWHLLLQVEVSRTGNREARRLALGPSPAKF